MDAAKLEGFYLFCMGRRAARRKDAGQGWSLAYAKDVFSVARTFIRWLAEHDYLVMPKKLLRVPSGSALGEGRADVDDEGIPGRAVEGSPEKLRAVPAAASELRHDAMGREPTARHRG